MFPYIFNCTTKNHIFSCFPFNSFKLYSFFFPESCIIHIVKMSACFLRYLTIWQEMIHFQFFLFQAIFWSIANQGLKKALSGSLPGRVNFPARQVSFHSHLPNGQGPREVICQLSEKKIIYFLPGKPKFESCFGQASIQCFLNPDFKVKLVIGFTSFSLFWQTFFTCDADAESTEPSDECEYYLRIYLEV